MLLRTPRTRRAAVPVLVSLGVLASAGSAAAFSGTNGDIVFVRNAVKGA